MQLISEAIVAGSLEAMHEKIEEERQTAREREMPGYSRSQRRVLKKLEAKAAKKRQQIAALTRAQKATS